MTEIIVNSYWHLFEIEAKERDKLRDQLEHLIDSTNEISQKNRISKLCVVKEVQSFQILSSAQEIFNDIDKRHNIFFDQLLSGSRLSYEIIKEIVELSIYCYRIGKYLNENKISDRLKTLKKNVKTAEQLGIVEYRGPYHKPPEDGLRRLYMNLSTLNDGYEEKMARDLIVGLRGFYNNTVLNKIIKSVEDQDSELKVNRPDFNDELDFDIEVFEKIVTRAQSDESMDPFVLKHNKERLYKLKKQKRDLN